MSDPLFLGSVTETPIDVSWGSFPLGGPCLSDQLQDRRSALECAAYLFSDAWPLSHCAVSISLWRPSGLILNEPRTDCERGL
jgi:hypothetical protein